MGIEQCLSSWTNNLHLLFLLPLHESFKTWRTFPMSFNKIWYSMGWNVLMFIVNQQRSSLGTKRNMLSPLGIWYNCGGDHLIKNCLYPRQPQPNPTYQVSILTKYWLECGIKHLVSDFSLNLEKKGKTMINLLEKIPSSSGNKGKQVKSINIVLNLSI